MGRGAQVSKMDLTFLSVGKHRLASRYLAWLCVPHEGVRLGQVVGVITLASMRSRWALQGYEDNTQSLTK